MEQIINEWTGKTVKLPNIKRSILYTKAKKNIQYDTAVNRGYKILLYVDSTGCSNCRLQLAEWKRLISETDTLFNGQLAFLFFLQPHKNIEKLESLFQQADFSYPVFIDTNNDIDRLNHFVKQDIYQCFLLDKDNKILAIGNPASNYKVWELYKKIITGEISYKPPVTTIEAEQTEIELKDLNVGKTSEAIFRLKNTGTNPLVIRQVESSCGCTVAEWDKQPITAGKNTEIKVKITPEKSEYFNKTVTVHCNIEAGQISFKIKGTVN
jgi:hypothetical protein